MVAIVDRPPAVIESSSPWRSARFRWYYVGSVTSWLGSAMAPIGLGFAVLAFSKSSSALGLVLAARSIPLISFMILGGAVADRISRSQLLMLSNLGSGVTQGAVAVLILSGSRNLGTIIVLEVANGTFSAFTTPAMAGIVPQLVSAGSQQSANSMLSAARADFDQDAGLRFLAAMVRAADLGLTLHDITGPAGVPVVACASASGETVYGAGAGLADAVREALTGVVRLSASARSAASSRSVDGNARLVDKPGQPGRGIWLAPAGAASARADESGLCAVGLRPRS